MPFHWDALAHAPELVFEKSVGIYLNPCSFVMLSHLAMVRRARALERNSTGCEMNQKENMLSIILKWTINYLEANKLNLCLYSASILSLCEVWLCVCVRRHEMAQRPNSDVSVWKVKLIATIYWKLVDAMTIVLRMWLTAHLHANWICAQRWNVAKAMFKLVSS